ncbi:MAG: HNH endonuclease [Leptolyngbyaceae cyanobacterium SM1_3_5]|nr:HNH endonuclease [Leptolyngbyaceae cyanobacterium SM1_3_5]
MAFVALYPLLDASIDLEEGQPHRLNELLEAYIKWYQEDGAAKWYAKHLQSNLDEDEEDESIELPELDDYRFIRAGLWWEVLASNHWKCCSCGRTVKEHGITLHVDHILPRSKGGTDSRENLQSLCMKCNIGKSNRDCTDLRR